MSKMTINLKRWFLFLGVFSVVVLPGCSGSNPVSNDATEMDATGSAKVASTHDAAQECTEERTSLDTRIKRLRALRDRAPVLSRTYTSQIDDLLKTMAQLDERCAQAGAIDADGDGADDEGAVAADHAGRDGIREAAARVQKCDEKLASLAARIERLRALHDRFPGLDRAYTPKIDNLLADLMALRERCAQMGARGDDVARGDDTNVDGDSQDRDDDRRNAVDRAQKCTNEHASLKSRIERLQDLRDRAPVRARTHNPQIDGLLEKMTELKERCAQVEDNATDDVDNDDADGDDATDDDDDDADGGDA